MVSSNGSVSSKQWREILSAVCRGDRIQLGKLICRYRPYLFRIAQGEFCPQLKGRISPSDIVQNVFLRIQKGLPRFQGRTEPQFRMWIRRILKNELQNTQRHHFSQKRHAGREHAGHDFELLRTDTTPSRALMRDEASRSLERFVEHLDPDYRQIVYLRHSQGLSFEEIADRLQRSPRAIRATWFRALDVLRQSFGDAPVGSSDPRF